ncbi:MAG: hypothetical protein AAFR84_02955 [Pseudomonadota bacterium]
MPDDFPTKGDNFVSIGDAAGALAQTVCEAYLANVLNSIEDAVLEGRGEDALACIKAMRLALSDVRVQPL